jgi:hypothetical protein
MPRSLGMKTPGRENRFRGLHGMTPSAVNTFFGWKTKSLQYTPERRLVEWARAFVFPAEHFTQDADVSSSMKWLRAFSTMVMKNS